ncbi:MAG TPA: head GIN domain-containing protein [Mucilaginibacter sp.]|nr:head GIN domain-containing protein [Mucilaginibacter sp.]
MKKSYSIAILFVAALSLSVLSSCRFGCIKGSGHQVTEQHKAGNFTRLDISGSFRVNLKQDSSLNVSVTADDNLMKYIHVNIDGDRLHIYSKKNLCSSGEMVLNIGVKNLEEIKASGGINLVSDGKLNTKDLRFKLNGASKVDMDLNADNVITEGNGSTEMNLRGQASSHKIEFAGSGKINALDFVVGSYDIETTGASECNINVLKDLNVNTTGAADIKYRGNPSSVNTNKMGAATVTKIN